VTCALCAGPVRYRWLYFDHKTQKAKKLCSSRCMDLWTMAWPDQEKFSTKLDFEAIEASLPDVGAVVAEIGMDKPVSEYTKDEILRLIYCAVTATQRHRRDLVGKIEVPF
jgi:hypothetical protein